MADSSAHTKLIVQELLPQAKGLVAQAERRLATQEARVADLQRQGHDARQSKRLLAIMRETMALQISHVKLLEREVRSDQGVEQTWLFGLSSGCPPWDLDGDGRLGNN